MLSDFARGDVTVAVSIEIDFFCPALTGDVLTLTVEELVAFGDAVGDATKFTDARVLGDTLTDDRGEDVPVPLVKELLLPLGDKAPVAMDWWLLFFPDKSGERGADIFLYLSYSSSTSTSSDALDTLPSLPLPDLLPVRLVSSAGSTVINCTKGTEFG
jgi:hypothetical protein